MEASLPTLPYSLRTFLNDGGDLCDIHPQALDELGRLVIFDRHNIGFVDWDRNVFRSFGAVEDGAYPAIIWRRWDSEVANNDGDLADRIQAQLPYPVIKKWQTRLENETGSQC